MKGSGITLQYEQIPAASIEMRSVLSTMRQHRDCRVKMLRNDILDEEKKWQEEFWS